MIILLASLGRKLNLKCIIFVSSQSAQQIKCTQINSSTHDLIDCVDTLFYSILVTHVVTIVITLN